MHQQWKGESVQEVLGKEVFTEEVAKAVADGWVNDILDFVCIN